jgi:hypothetical protein
MNSNSLTKTTQPSFALPALLSDAINSNLWKVGKVLEKITEQGDQISRTFMPINFRVTPFFSQSTLPRCSIQTFFMSLCLLAGLQDEQAVLPLILVERICQRSA